ncbi:threonine/serine exporter family protein [Bradyrhizobium sp. C-145]|uniref:threonine/serine ThrE exporter family protein n=1 Tax=Bradyrhizobium sp. C-145 TaxID=574727 RepID=UPI00201B7015|nr:threonine/serine exporter family protein [Bradyrhizobium sp. C-145]UQR63178.1 threonine/serine exporter family protein [Bradyrhizobium sp. C-145]
METTALAATLLFSHGQTTERTVAAAERLGHALGVTVTVLPYWGELIVKVDGAAVSHIVPAKPLGVDMGRVLAVTSVIDQICHGKLPAAAARSALESAGRLPPASTPRFTLFAAIGAASLGVIFGTPDATSLLLIAASAAIGALVRRRLSGFSQNPLIQPLCAALIAGVVAAAAGRFQRSNAATLVGFCPCMVLVPGPHILNGAIDLARTRIALGLARLAYAGIIVLLVCDGGLFGFTAAGGNLAIAGPSPPVPLSLDVIAAGCAVASFGTFFSMPWRLLAFPIAVGMPAHAARWAQIVLAGGSAPSGALVACILVSVLTAPVVDRLHLPFAAVAFSAVVSLMPGFFLFNTATGLVELVSIGPDAPAALLISIVANGATAFLIIMAMAFGLILPRMLYERLSPSPV